MKSHVMLTTALFLAFAPAPDSGDIAELTSNFIVPENHPELSAGDLPLPTDSEDLARSDADRALAQQGPLPASSATS
ncbi:MAG: hypothetical protein HKN58_05085 [Xanthomonadales bacterium]|nr:hypothetical protein [Xanthomonadales bacterium]